MNNQNMFSASGFRHLILSYIDSEEIPAVDSTYIKLADVKDIVFLTGNELTGLPVVVHDDIFEDDLYLCISFGSDIRYVFNTDKYVISFD